MCSQMYQYQIHILPMNENLLLCVNNIQKIIAIFNFRINNKRRIDDPHVQEKSMAESDILYKKILLESTFISAICRTPERPRQKLKLQGKCQYTYNVCKTIRLHGTWQK